jgi:hypothetical protein
MVERLTAGWARGRRWLGENPDQAAIGLILALYLVGRARSPYPAIDGDGHYTWLWARSLVFDHDIDLDNDARLCGDPWRRGLGPTGHALNQWPLGPALLWAPLLQLARWLLPGAAPACRGSWAEAAMYGSALAGAASLALAVRMGRRHDLPRGALALGVLLVGLASMLPYYAVYLPSYSHAATALSGALFVERWDRYRDEPTPRRGLLLGALLGVAMLMRTQSAILGLLPFLSAVELVARTPAGERGRALGRWALPAVLFLATALLVEAPYRWALHRMYGSPFAIPQGSAYMRWAHSNPAGLLFSSYNGLLTTTPLLYPGVLALLLLPFWPRHRRLWPLTVLFLAALYINGAVWDWWGEASFSSRRLTDFSGPFALATALVAAALFRLAEQAPTRVAASAGALGILLGGLWNQGAMISEAEGRTRQIGARPAPERWTPVMNFTGQHLWKYAGNPLAWPASLPFALRYRVHPRAFDRLVGEGLFRKRYNDLRLEPGSDLLDFTAPDEFFPDGFSPARGSPPLRGRTLLGEGRILLPLFDTGIAAVEVEALPQQPTTLRLRWGERLLGEATVTDGSPRARFDLPPQLPRVGVNELHLATPLPLPLVNLRLLERR